jgi:hypothetical protein
MQYFQMPPVNPPATVLTDMSEQKVNHLTGARARLCAVLLVLFFFDQVFPIGAGALSRTREAAAGTGYVRPEFAATMRALRPSIIAAAERHNQPHISLMSDREFAVAMTIVLYNEHVGWLEDAMPALRPFTPYYQRAQVEANALLGADLTVWPSNLRPSVVDEILRDEVPVPAGVITVPIVIAGGGITGHSYPDDRARYRMITRDIIDPALAVEYLAANLERGLYRAAHERVDVTWRTLAAWHNQGIVAPAAIAASPAARHYLQRAERYVPHARALIEGNSGARQHAAFVTRAGGDFRIDSVDRMFYNRTYELIRVG